MKNYLLTAVKIYALFLKNSSNYSDSPEKSIDIYLIKDIRKKQNKSVKTQYKLKNQ